MGRDPVGGTRLATRCRRLPSIPVVLPTVDETDAEKCAPSKSAHLCFYFHFALRHWGGCWMSDSDFMPHGLSHSCICLESSCYTAMCSVLIIPRQSTMSTIDSHECVWIGRSAFPTCGPILTMDESVRMSYIDLRPVVDFCHCRRLGTSSDT